MWIRATLYPRQVRIADDTTCDLVGILSQVVADDQRLWVGIANHGGNLGRGQAPVDRTSHRPGFVEREEKLDVVVGVLVEDGHSIARLDSQPFDQPCRELRARSIHLIEGALLALVPSDWEIRPP